jgi:hypothetical protein
MDHDDVEWIPTYTAMIITSEYVNPRRGIPFLHAFLRFFFYCTTGSVSINKVWNILTRPIPSHQPLNDSPLASATRLVLFLMRTSAGDDFISVPIASPRYMALRETVAHLFGTRPVSGRGLQDPLVGPVDLVSGGRTDLRGQRRVSRPRDGDPFGSFMQHDAACTMGIGLPPFRLYDKSCTVDEFIAACAGHQGLLMDGGGA